MSNTKQILNRMVTLGALAFLLSGLLVGCGGAVGDESRTVGGPCETHSDCSDRCLVDWPGGMCTLTCESDDDCPTGSACIDYQDGVCLMKCEEDRDCPGGYECDDKDRFGHSGKMDVCEED